MIQCISRARKKGGAFTFILFTPKWTKIKDPKEIKKHNAGLSSSTAVNAQLLDRNQPKPLTKVGFLS